jgi:hypothetical protein
MSGVRDDFHAAELSRVSEAVQVWVQGRGLSSRPEEYPNVVRARGGLVGYWPRKPKPESAR